MPKIKKLKILSLCDGVATGREVLKRLGIACDYYAIENDPIKRKIADANHKGIIRPAHDVIEFADSIDFEFFDMVVCGFTCSSLTSQGGRSGFDGDSKIFFDCLKIVEGCQKVNPKLNFFFENVASMTNECREIISKELGVKHFLGEAGLVSAQDRNRYYWFNWTHPVITPVHVDPISLLDEDGLLMFSVSKSNRNKKGEKAIVEGRFKANGKAGTLVTGKGCRGQSTVNYVVTKKLETRLLTTGECARFQGIGNYTWPCTDNEIFTAIGHGWQANMVEAILKTAPILNKAG